MELRVTLRCSHCGFTDSYTTEVKHPHWHPNYGNKRTITGICPTCAEKGIEPLKEKN